MNGEKDLSTVGGILTDESKACLKRLQLITLPHSITEPDSDGNSVDDQDLWGQLTIAKTERNLAQAKIAELQAGLFSGEVLYAEECDRVMHQRIANCKSKILSLSSGLARMLRGAAGELVAAEVGSSVSDILRELPHWNIEHWRASSVTVFAKAKTQESDDEV